MKKIIPILLIILSACQSGFDDTSKHNDNWIWWHAEGQDKGKWIEKSSDGTWAPDDGLYVCWYSNGQKEQEGNYKNGKKKGKWFGWFEDGHLHSEVNFVKDTIQGLGVWYKYADSLNGHYINDYIKIESVTKNGKRSGKDTYYFPSGKIMNTSFYVNGIKHGIESQYYENGSTKAKMTYKNGELDSNVNFWNANGILIAKANFANGNP